MKIRSDFIIFQLIPCTGPEDPMSFRQTNRDGVGMGGGLSSEDKCHHRLSQSVGFTQE